MQSDTACFQAALEAKCAELLSYAHKREEIRIEHVVDTVDDLQQQVKAALVRIQSGDFGICVGCDKSIPARRLYIVPWVAYCVSCQEQVDRFAKDHTSDSDLNVVED